MPRAPKPDFFGWLEEKRRAVFLNLEAERRFCRCGEAAPRGLHALVRRARDGEGDGRR